MSILEKSLHEEIQLKGAAAMAAGLGELSNPYLREENMPKATGDSIEICNAKHDAWQLGWRAEAAIRS